MTTLARLTSVRRRDMLYVLAAGAGVSSGCAGSDDAPTAGSTATAAPRLLDPDEFASEVDGGKRVVLNVHTPDAGSIPGTDMAIPYDRLKERASELPASRATPLAVYCLTGRMSAVAVDTLTALGYQDVVELRGGMAAWQQSGRTLLPAAGRTTG